MPEQEVAFLFDDIVLWLSAGTDRDNEEQVLTSYHINGRWDPDVHQMRDATGKLVNTDVAVIVEEKEEITIGSIMWLGLVQDLPNPPTNLFKVIAICETRDIRARSPETQIGLVRYKNTLPNIVGSS